MSSKVLDRPLILTEPKDGALKVAFDSAQERLPRLSDLELSGLQTKHDNLVEEERQMLGIETDAKTTVQAEIRRVEKELRTHRTNLPVLSVEAFQMRDEKGYPLLVPFALDKNTISISGSSTDSPQINLPAGARKHYQDVVAALAGQSAYSWRAFNIPFGILGMFLVAFFVGFPLVFMSFFDAGIRFGIFAILAVIVGYWTSGVYTTPDLKITARYTGALPIRIRALIRMNQKYFDQICILAEVKEWAIDQVVIPKLDPLVIGYLEATDSWSLLGAFETTPLENYIEAEFTT